MSQASCPHVRVNTSLLAEPERRLLHWLAARLPRAVGSDHLTLLALVAMAATGGAFAVAREQPLALLLVPVTLAVNWFGDSLDGTLARVRQQQRPRYGYYVDHVLDVAGMTLLMVGLAWSGFMTPVVAVGLLSAYLLVSAEVFLATTARAVFRMSFAGVGPTELRLLLSAGALALLWKPSVSIAGAGPFLLFDVGGAVAAAGLLGAFITAAARNTVALYREEPLPGASRPPIS